MSESPLHRTQYGNVASLLVLGFAVLIVLMTGLLVHGVWQIGELKERMRDIVEVRNLKIQLATDLQEASYNRHNALVYQALANDSFERDDNFQLYIKWGYRVGKVRNDLKALPLDAFEQANLMRQDQLVTRIIVMQETISDLAARGEVEQARTLLAAELRPLNLEYTEVVEALRRHERDLIRDALIQAQQATNQAITLHLTLGGVLILLAVAISTNTKRQLGRHTQTIYAQVNELREVGCRLQHEATHDPLTGLANRSLFYRRLEEDINHAAEDQFSLAVMYVDLDDFKQVNDRYGHATGDCLLKAVATRLRGVVRKTDTVARLGGDEFALILMGLEETGQCPDLCVTIEQAVSQPLQLGEIALVPHCSIGYATYPADGEHLDELLNAADARMYEVKRARKLARDGAAVHAALPAGAQAGSK